VNRYLAVMFGGAAGSLLRYVIGLAIINRYAGTFPVATFLINLTGSFLIGLALTVIPSNSSAVVRPLLVTGFIGGYTTFSAFEWEAFVSPRTIAISYVVLSVMLGFVACWAGAALGRYVSR
jgi:CrcB protein